MLALLVTVTAAYELYSMSVVYFACHIYNKLVQSQLDVNLVFTGICKLTTITIICKLCDLPCDSLP